MNPESLVLESFLDPSTQSSILFQPKIRPEHTDFTKVQHLGGSESITEGRLDGATPLKTNMVSQLFLLALKSYISGDLYRWKQ